MRMLKRLLRTAAVLLAAAVLAAAVSALPERGGGDVLFSLGRLRFTVTGSGAALGFLVSALFAAIWRAGIRKRKDSAAGTWLNAIGFGFLPGAAVWKVFERGTLLSTGVPVFDPLPAAAYLTSGECFEVSGIEAVLAVLCFTGLVLWLMIRRDDLQGNGEVLQVVLCLWGMSRALTESLRTDPLLCAGPVNLIQVLFLITAAVPFVLWTGRLRKAQKSTAPVLPEGIAVLCCGAVMVLVSSGILSTGSGVGDLAVNTGCTLLGILLILLAGKDCRN